MTENNSHQIMLNKIHSAHSAQLHASEFIPAAFGDKIS
jgi:hypothetical protein